MGNAMSQGCGDRWPNDTGRVETLPDGLIDVIS